ncbi:hypothetical protein [Mesoplasma photuris]|uniref:hypothetical protein n=1 Tax=Mesoplasma photuris TaxID=217731 RepID=UPI00146F9B8C|nr:hypothetical protein [Mesoplasma photuris]
MPKVNPVTKLKSKSFFLFEIEILLLFNKKLCPIQIKKGAKKQIAAITINIIVDVSKTLSPINMIIYFFNFIALWINKKYIEFYN